jgi:hypothetical protein
MYDSLADVLRDVSLGRIKAGFGDGPILAYQLSQNKDFRQSSCGPTSRKWPATWASACARPTRAAAQDQRVARQAQGKRDARQDPRQVEP